MNKKIIWDSKHLEFDTLTGDIRQSEDSEPEDDGNKYIDSADGMDEEVSVKLPKVMQTPWGIFSVDDKMNPLREFEFWQGHTNFDITKEIAETIQKIPGVEVLNVFTRYRFFVAVGRAFSFKEVRRDIEMAVCDETSKMISKDEFLGSNGFDIGDEDVLYEVEKLQSELEDKYDKWGILILPNGEIEYCILEEDGDEEKFEAELQMFRDSEEEIGSILIESENNY